MKKEVLDLIDLNTPQRYTLSIRLASDGFCFSLCDRFENGNIIPFFYKIDTVSSELANIKGVFDDISDLLQCNFFKVYILLDTDRVLVAPNNMFDEEDFNSAYSFCYEMSPGEKILYTVSERTDRVFVYPINKYVKNFLDDCLDGIVYLPSAYAVMEHCSLLSKEEGNKDMFVCISGEKMLIAAFEKSGLLFFNGFDCDCDSDRLFYIMNVWNTLLFSQTDDKLFLLSESGTTVKLETLLGNYLAKIEVMPRNEQLKSLFSKNSVFLNYDLEALITDNII